MAMLASPLMHMVNGTMIEIDGGQEKSLMDRLRDRKSLTTRHTKLIICTEAIRRDVSSNRSQLLSVAFRSSPWSPSRQPRFPLTRTRKTRSRSARSTATSAARFPRALQAGHRPRGRGNQQIGRRPRQEDRADLARRRRQPRRCGTRRRRMVSRERVNILVGGFLSNVGLAVTNMAARKVLLPRRRAADRQDRLAERQQVHLPPALLHVHAGRHADARIVAVKKKRWAVVYPNFEYGQSAVEAFKKLLKEKQPDAEIVTEQAPPLGKVDAGAVAQAIDDAKPDAIFNVLFGPDLAKFVREGNTRGTFQNRFVASLLSGEPEYNRSAARRGTGRLARDRLSLVRDCNTGAQSLPRCLSGAVPRLSPARLGRRLRNHQIDRRRDHQGGLDRHRQAGRRVREASRSTAPSVPSSIGRAITRRPWAPMSAKPP